MERAKIVICLPSSLVGASRVKRAGEVERNISPTLRLNPEKKRKAARRGATTREVSSSLTCCFSCSPPECAVCLFSRDETDKRERREEEKEEQERELQQHHPSLAYAHRAGIKSWVRAICHLFHLEFYISTEKVNYFPFPQPRESHFISFSSF